MLPPHSFSFIFYLKILSFLRKRQPLVYKGTCPISYMPQLLENLVKKKYVCSIFATFQDLAFLTARVCRESLNKKVRLGEV